MGKAIVWTLKGLPYALLIICMGARKMNASTNRYVLQSIRKDPTLEYLSQLLSSKCLPRINGWDSGVRD